MEVFFLSSFFPLLGTLPVLRAGAFHPPMPLSTDPVILNLAYFLPFLTFSSNESRLDPFPSTIFSYTFFVALRSILFA